jgi:3'-phosphoadenosine 5'-phosphosulfate sulfotransferase (PAPS reductase)/FAD synthetase
MREDLIADAAHTISEAEQRGATRFYALVSGGKDSITAAHVVNGIRPLDGVLFIDTTIGLSETRRFVEEFCRERGWPLTILQPAMTYDAIVAKYGFPGPSMHRYTYIYLKWKPLAAWVRAHPDRKHLALISGLRRTESKRRGRTVRAAVERDRSCKDLLFVAPLSNWPDGGRLVVPARARPPGESRVRGFAPER